MVVSVKDRRATCAAKNNRRPPPGSQAPAWEPTCEKLLLLVFRVLANELGNMANVHLSPSRSRSFSKARSQAEPGNEAKEQSPPLASTGFRLIQQTGLETVALAVHRATEYRDPATAFPAVLLSFGIFFFEFRICFVFRILIFEFAALPRWGDWWPSLTHDAAPDASLRADNSAAANACPTGRAPTCITVGASKKVPQSKRRL